MLTNEVNKAKQHVNPYGHSLTTQHVRMAVVAILFSLLVYCLLMYI
jgi:hypothetical protein